MSRPVLRIVSAGVGLATAAALTVLGGGAAYSQSGSARVDHSASQVSCVATGQGDRDATQRAFADASRAAGVPESVLLAVSYLESRWDAHVGQSSSGGYGPMNLTDASAAHLNADGRGEGAARMPEGSLTTARLASRLTGSTEQVVKTDVARNICGGAAVLASFQRGSGHATGADTSPASWADAVARYSGAATPTERGRFVTQTYDVLRKGAARTTHNGQRVALGAHPDVRTPTAKAPAAESSKFLDCPRSLHCEWFGAPYEWYGEPDPGAYGNHDLADRPRTMKIRYIVIHDSEATWETDRELIKDPTYISWQYTVNSLTGQVAQHVANKDVAFQAGNWYVNMHSIGIEHTGFAAQGASWYTESMYRTSAALVRHLAKEYGIPLDRAHIIGHDQVPGITPAYVAGMHWDPGPYWDWEHYFDLLRAPIGGHHRAAAPQRLRKAQVVTVRPGFAHNRQAVTGCDTSGSGTPCAKQGSNFVYMHQDPSTSSPLVVDEGLHTDGSASTEDVSDIGARATAGQKLVVAARQGSWLGVWYLGRIAWLHDPAARPVVVRSHGVQVTPAQGLASAPVYGRAFPEDSAYPSTVPAADHQTITPLQYTLKAGQRYVLADAHVPTDYYHSTQYPDAPGQRIDIVGTTKYYQVWVGHRQMFVMAKDVRLLR